MRQLVDVMPGPARPAVSSAKRALDVGGAVLLLCVLSPVLLIVGLFVKLSSPGSVLFRQLRVGLNGHPFRMLKFRTMRAECEGPLVTAGDDSRITGLGRMLRKSKVDELPQLWNVICGEMSLVGPRPEVPLYVRCYTEAQRRALSVRPGITGASQVLFRHEEELLREHAEDPDYYRTVILPCKLAVDVQYIDEWSLVGDLRLLARTVGALFSREPHPRERSN